MCSSLSSGMAQLKIGLLKQLNTVYLVLKQTLESSFDGVML